jgi:hypothetical protein
MHYRRERIVHQRPKLKYLVRQLTFICQGYGRRRERRIFIFLGRVNQ